MILYSHSYRSIEDFVRAPDQEFAQVPSLGAERVGQMRTKALAAIDSGFSTERRLQELIAEDEAKRAAAAAIKAEADAIQAAAVAAAASEETVPEGAGDEHVEHKG